MSTTNPETSFGAAGTPSERPAAGPPIQTIASESVSRGHPDKVADQISDAVLDAALRVRTGAHVACETLVTNGLVVVAGEVSDDVRGQLDVEAIVRSTVAGIGYTSEDVGLDAAQCEVICRLNSQSPDIAAAVSKRDVSGDAITDDQGAGDQGMMYGFACRDTPSLMPLPIDLAHRLLIRLEEVRAAGDLPWARPDAKSQVAVEYSDGRPRRIANVVMAVQHEPGVDAKRRQEELRRLVVDPVLPGGLADALTGYFLASKSEFVRGGPAADTGLTGRKIIVDTYGGIGRHGGGAFSGKDPSKVDRSGAYMARFLARHVVAAGLAERCEVQVAYVLGHRDPVALHVNTFGGAAGASDWSIAQLLGRVVDASPAGIIKKLDLLRPIYLPTAAYGHFGRPGLPWERTDIELVAALQGLAAQ